MGDIDPPLCQQVLNITQAQSEPTVKPHGVLDDYGRKLKVLVTDRAHQNRLARGRSIRKPILVTMPHGLLARLSVLQKNQ
jgi:hypothetical protein